MILAPIFLISVQYAYSDGSINDMGVGTGVFIHHSHSDPGFCLYYKAASLTGIISCSETLNVAHHLMGTANIVFFQNPYNYWSEG